MRILSIDTSCDETAAAVTDGTKVLANVIWSQAALHAKFGGVMPSLAQRQHEERIDFVVQKALKSAFPKKLVPNPYQQSWPNSTYSLIPEYIDAIAVTYGPGLAIALGVGVNKAKELAEKYKKPLIPINHIEAHLLSPLAKAKSKIQNSKSKQFKNSRHQIQNHIPTTNHQQLITFPTFGLVLSGGNTQFVLINNIGDYEILAETVDDALGEALDKSARLLGFGYPGGAILEEFAKKGDPGKFDLPLPLKDDKVKNRFSYSGLKTAFVRLLKEVGDPTPEQINDLAASFQDAAFDHIINVLDYQISHQPLTIKHLLFGGGVSNNIEIRKRLRKLCRKHDLKLLVPYSKKLTTDNAAMIGVCAYLKYENLNANNLNAKFKDLDKVDRSPRARIA